MTPGPETDEVPGPDRRSRMRRDEGARGRLFMPLQGGSGVPPSPRTAAKWGAFLHRGRGKRGQIPALWEMAR